MSGIAILGLLTVGFLATEILLALLYLIPIICVRRFHTINNLHTLNLCVAILLCCAYGLSNAIIYMRYSHFLSNHAVCALFAYLEMTCTIQMPLALIEVSTYRLCSIVYSAKPFFRTKRWAAICFASQWTIGILLPLPQLIANASNCDTHTWERVYALVVVVIVPSIACLVNNIIIFKHVRSSSGRVQPASADVHGQQPQPISRRDLHLLRHMIVMFCVFVGGWAPVDVYAVFSPPASVDPMWFTILAFFAEVTLLVNLVNLFLYNRELRQYFRERLFCKR